MPLHRREIILIVLTVLVVLGNFILFRWDSIKRITSDTTKSFFSRPASNTTLAPSPSVTVAKGEASYVQPVFREQSSTLQINGVLDGFGDDWVSITAKDARYLASVTQTSYAECRSPTVVGPDGKTIPAHTIFYDLSRYILNLKENGKTMAEKGQILLYPQVKARFSKDIKVLAVVEKEKSNKGNTLVLLIVYGCL